jgi:hypothetical protein
MINVTARNEKRYAHCGSRHGFRIHVGSLPICISPNASQGDKPLRVQSALSGFTENALAAHRNQTNERIGLACTLLVMVSRLRRVRLQLRILVLSPLGATPHHASCQLQRAPRETRPSVHARIPPRFPAVPGSPAYSHMPPQGLNHRTIQPAFTYATGGATVCLCASTAAFRGGTRFVRISPNAAAGPEPSHDPTSHICCWWRYRLSVREYRCVSRRHKVRPTYPKMPPQSLNRRTLRLT